MGVLRNRKTGVWLEDFAFAHDILSEAGYEVTTASPRGGEIPVDPDSMRATEPGFFEPDIWLERKKELLLESVPLGEIMPDEYDAVYYPGGYGSFWDLSVNRDNAELLESFVNSGKPVAAIRHGGAALLSAKTPAGESILNGRRVTGASDDEERQMALDRVRSVFTGETPEPLRSGVHLHRTVETACDHGRDAHHRTKHAIGR